MSPSAHADASPEPAVLLTGATGFLGMEILARLLQRTNRRVLALVRASSHAEAESRLRSTLGALFGARHAYADRVAVVRGDLTAPCLGLGPAWGGLPARVGEIIHSAATVSFSLPLEASRAVNLEGTRRVLDLARACRGLRRLTYVSTAYVAGERRGRILEGDLVAGQRFRNAYEQSKYEAERLVRTAADALPVTIVRPSIIVGDRETGWTAAFNVLYAPLRAFAAGAYRVVPARRSAPVDVVSVDYVADAVLALAAAPQAVGRTFHIVAGDQATSVGELVRLATQRFGRRAPRLVPPGPYRRLVEPLLARRSAPATRRLLERTRMYFPYFAMGVRFDDREARAVLEPLGVRPERLAAYFDRLVDFAQAARWGRRPIGRADARALVGQPPAAARGGDGPL